MDSKKEPPDLSDPSISKATQDRSDSKVTTSSNVDGDIPRLADNLVDQSNSEKIEKNDTMEVFEDEKNASMHTEKNKVMAVAESTVAEATTSSLVDDMTGFLNNLVDQSISEMIEKNDSVDVFEDGKYTSINIEKNDVKADAESSKATTSSLVIDGDMTGFLDNLVDQSISEMIKKNDTMSVFEDKEGPRSTRDEKKEVKTSSGSSKLKPKAVSDIDVYKAAVSNEGNNKTSVSLPSAASSVNAGMLDTMPGTCPHKKKKKHNPWNLRRNTLIRQYQKVILASHSNHSPITRDEYQTAVALFGQKAQQATKKQPVPKDKSPKEDEESLNSLISGFVDQSISSIVQEVATKDRSLKEDNLFDDLVGSVVHETIASVLKELEESSEENDLIDGFVTHSIASVVSEIDTEKTYQEEDKKLDDFVDDFVDLSISSIATENTMRLASKEEDDGRLDSRNDILSNSIDKDTDQTACFQTSEIDTQSCQSNTEVKMQDESLAPITADTPSVHNVTERKDSIFGFIFRRRKSKGSLKVKLPKLRFACCMTTADDGNADNGLHDNSVDAKEPKAKKRGFISRMLSCFKKRRPIVAPMHLEN